MSELRDNLLERQEELRQELNGVEAALTILDGGVKKPQVKRLLYKKAYRKEGTTYWIRRALAEIEGGVTVKMVEDFARKHGAKINRNTCSATLTKLKNKGEAKKVERGYALA